MNVEKVLREMRYQNLEEEADFLEAAMREPKACYWMSSKWHRYEVHMADDLPCNAPHDMRFLFAFPPDAKSEIERLREALAMAGTADEDLICDNGYSLAYVVTAALAPEMKP